MKHRKKQLNHPPLSIIKLNEISGIMSQESPDFLGPLCLCVLEGLRLDEALDLHWSDIDFSKGTAVIRKLKNCKPLRPTHSSLDSPEKPFSTVLRLLLLQLMGKSDPDSEPLVFHWNGKPISTNHAIKVLRREIKRINCPTFSFYDLRKSYARALIKKTEEPLKPPSAQTDESIKRGIHSPRNRELFRVPSSGSRKNRRRN